MNVAKFVRGFLLLFCSKISPAAPAGIVFDQSRKLKPVAIFVYMLKFFINSREGISESTQVVLGYVGNSILAFPRQHVK